MSVKPRKLACTTVVAIVVIGLVQVHSEVSADEPTAAKDPFAAASDATRPSLDEIMEHFAGWEQAYVPFRIKAMETFRMSDGLTAEQRIRYPWGDGRKHQRLMEFAQNADRVWYTKETHLADDVQNGPRYEHYNDGGKLVGVNISDPRRGQPPQVFLGGNPGLNTRWIMAVPITGVFPLTGFSNGDLLTKLARNGQLHLQLDWDDDDAKLTFEYGPDRLRSRYVLWLSRAHDWHPIKLQHYMPASAKQFLDAWIATRFVKDAERWRIAEGSIWYRDHRDAGSPDAKVMYSLDFRILEAEWGKPLPAELFRYEIPEGAEVHDRQQPKPEKPVVTATREISVKVVGVDRQPVPGATVRLSGTRGGGELDRVTVDEEGVARSAKAPDDDVGIAVEAAGLRPARWVLGRTYNGIEVILAPQTRGTTVDERGTPIPTVWITSDRLQVRADGMPYVPHGQSTFDPPDWSDADAQFSLRKSLTLRNVDTPVPLIAMDERAERMAIEFLTPGKLGEEQKLVLNPVCRVHGLYLLEGVTEAEAVNASLAAENGQHLGSVQLKTEVTPGGLQAELNLRLPPGNYSLAARQSSRYPGFTTPITIAAGQHELDLGAFTVPASGTIALKGNAAPQLEVRWRPGQETTLDKLRGKVVVLDFWGTWCGPCIRDMPKLMDIAERFRHQGVVCLTIHTPTELDFAEFDREVADIKHRSWKDRDLPFTTVIDLPASADGKAGKTATQYGVALWPTLIVIDQSGKVIGAVSKDDLAEVIGKLLDRASAD
jgi:thiol-disulfide isomerase/thioredoxin